MTQNRDHELVILVYYFGNDFQNNIRPDKFSPRFVLEKNRLVVLPPTESGYANARDHKRSLWNVIRERSYLINTVANIVDSIGRGFSAEELAKGQQLTRALLVSLANYVRANGAHLLIVSLPSWDEIAKRSRTALTDLQEESIQEALTENPDVVYLPLTPELLKKGGIELYGLDRHLNPRGYFEAASLIANVIASRRLLQTMADTSDTRWVKAPPVMPDCSMHRGQ
jgi:hypothetical protein